MNRAIAGPSTYVPSRTAARPRPRGSAHTSRRRALTVRSAEDAVGAVWVVEGSRAETPGEAGFAEDFYFDLGGSTPAPVKGIRFNTGSIPVTVTIPRPLGVCPYLCTVNPSSFIPNHKPCTLKPKPQTPNPKP
jgi:hypothetical protein